MRWLRLCDSVGLDGSEEWNLLEKGYCDPPRAYHNLNHISDCLDQLDQFVTPSPDQQALEFAIWYHDLIYDSKAADNETRSATEAERFLVGLPMVSQVVGLILATRHLASDLSEDCQRMVDIDLSILGRSEEIYDRYASAIRNEYNWVPHEAYIQGRSEVLRGFLDRASIYSTPAFQVLYEDAARLNLQRELENLSALSS